MGIEETEPFVLEADDPKLDEALELMRDLVRVPLGDDPERDAKIEAAWRSDELVMQSAR